MRTILTASLLYDAALSVVYPRECAVCQAAVESRADGVACDRCWSETQIFSEYDLLCWKCGVPSHAIVRVEDRSTVRCRRCDDLNFDAARACGIYDVALRASVLALKRDPGISKRIARLLSGIQRREPLCNATKIIPVPLHSSRLRERGFNQAVLLGEALARLNKVAIDVTSLARTAETQRHRAGMDARSRRDNVEKAFRVVRPRMIRDQSILLIDDVFTTGATVSSCADVLKTAGAREVFVLTLARPRDLHG